MSYKDEAKRSREDKARRIVGAAHGGSVSRGDAKKIADAAVDRHRRHAYHLGPEEIAKDVKKDVKKDCYARGGKIRRAEGGKLTPEDLRAAYAKSNARASNMSPQEIFDEATKIGPQPDSAWLNKTGQKRGGRVDHYARGGRTKKGGKGDVNIIIDTAPKAPAMAPPMAALPPRPAMPPAPSPAPPAPPPGAAPGMPTRPGMPPMGGPPMRAAGGPVKMKYGAGSGEGRLEKISKRRGA